jgi:hypothetical protein
LAVVVPLCLAVGFAGGLGLWHRANVAREARAADEAAAGPRLAAGTREVLRALGGSVTVRYYAILEPSVSDAVREFAGRTDRLLAAFQQESGGRLTLARTDVRSDAGLQAARGEGLRPFNLERGEACYLGIVVTGEGGKESLAALAPEWEPALEYDIARAVARVGRPPSKVAATTNAVELAAERDVREALTNLTALSAEQATQTLREAAFSEYKAATEAMQARVGEAQERLKQAQEAGTEADRQAALVELHRAQAEGMEELKEIAARLQDQVTAVERIKGVTRPAPTRGKKTGGAMP